MSDVGSRHRPEDFDQLTERLASSAAVQRWGAAAFDRYVGQLSHTAVAHVDALVEAAGIDARCRVLDLGCGSGGLGCHIAQRTGCALVGVDWARAALARATTRAREAGLARRVRFEWCDLPHGLPAGPFDVVIAIDVLQLLPEIDATVSAAMGALRPGGRLAIIATVERGGRVDEPDLPSRDALIAACGRAALAVVDERTLTPSYAQLVGRMRERWLERFDDLREDLGTAVAQARLDEDEKLLRLLRAGRADRILLVARRAARPLPDLRILDRATLRAAAWPIETLDPFASPVLADAARRLRSAETDPEAFRRAHAEALEREREALEHLARTPEFRKALMVANPQLARRWETPPPAERRRTARWSRVQAAVLRSLMRACGRPTPGGAWAGVAPVAPAADGGLAVRPSPARHHAVADLRAFRAALIALSRCARYRDDGPLTLEPTLRPTADTWSWEHDHDGVRRWTSVPRHPVFDALVARLMSGGPMSARELVAAVQDATGGDELRGVVRRLVERGFLRTALEEPVACADTWGALTEVGERLLPADRAAWTACVEGVKDVCDELGRRYDTLGPPEVEQLMSAARDHQERLWRRCGLGDAPPESCIRLSMHVPFEVTWDEGWRRRVQDAVRDLLGFHAGDGAAELYRRQSLQPIVAVCPPGASVAVEELLGGGRLGWPVAPMESVARTAWLGVPETREEILAPTLRDADPEAARAHCDWWAQQTAALQNRVEAVIDAPDGAAPQLARPGPSGSVLLRLAAPAEVWCGPGRPEPAGFRSCADAFVDTATAPAAAFRERDALADGAGVLLAALVPDDAELGPAVAGPTDAALPRLLPHGREGSSLTGVRLTLDEDLRPWLFGPSGDGPTALVYDGVAAAGFDDGCARLLLTLARGHGWELPSFGVPPSEAERLRWHYLPRLRAPGGAVLSPRRWTLGGDELAAIAASGGAEQYAAWRAWIDRRSVPEVVHVRTFPAPELLMRTDSALAVDALFRKLPAGTRWLSLEELPGDPSQWPVRSPSRQHHLAELAVTWSMPGHWRAVRPTADAARPVDPEDPGVARALGDGAAEWLQVDCEPRADGGDRPDGLPWSELADALERWRAEGRLDGFSFLRKPPVLRLRFGGPQVDEALEPILSRWLGDLVAAGRLRAFRRTRYEPEMHRFGGPEGLLIAHRLFDRDSTLLVRFQALSAEGGRELPRTDELALALAADLVSRSVEDGAEAWDVWMRIRAGLGTPTGTRGEPVPRRYLAAGAPEWLSTLAPPGQRLAAEWVRAHSEAAAALRAAHGAGRLTVGRRSWLASACVFHFNRAGVGRDQLGPLLAALAELWRPPEHRS